MEDMLRNYSCSDGTGLSGSSVTTGYWSSESYSDTSLASAIISLCFIIVGLPCNLLIIFGILRQQLYNQPTYILLLNLAISDLLVCVLVLPFTVMSGFAREFILGANDKMRCQMCQMGILLSLFAEYSLYCLAALSLDRLIFIKFPLKYFHIVTARRTATAAVTLWLLNVLLSILPLFGFGDIFYQNTIATCTVAFSSKTKVAPNYYYIIMLAVVSIPPFVLILVANIWIVFIIQKHIRKLYNIKGNSQNKEEFIQSLKIKVSKSAFSKQLQLFKVFGAIFVANVFTWIPIILRSFLAASNISFSEWQYFVVFSSLLSFVVLHPIIQASLIPEFRSYIVVFLKKILCFCCKNFSDSQPFCPGCYHTTKANDSGNGKGLCECACSSSCCAMMSVTVLPIRDEFTTTTTITS